MTRHSDQSAIAPMGQGGSMHISTRYAQHKGGQKLHIVPVLSGDTNMADTALCGKHVDYWRTTYNVPLGMCCGNCARIDHKRGYARALDIIRAAWARVAA